MHNEILLAIYEYPMKLSNNFVRNKKLTTQLYWMSTAQFILISVILMRYSNYKVPWFNLSNLDEKHFGLLFVLAKDKP